MDKRIYRAIDANINRSLEGIRVCEDIFRFIYNSPLAVNFKKIRHEIRFNLEKFPKRSLLNSRLVPEDKQKFKNLPSENTRTNLEVILTVNFHRSLEALRSLEEFSKLFDSQLGHNFQKIRFKTYKLEKKALFYISKLNILNKFNQSLYAIIDSNFVKNNNYVQTTKHLIAGGVDLIQLRIKNRAAQNTLLIAKDISKICRQHKVIFIVNDYPDIAFLAKADGVHLGENDISIKESKSILSGEMIIGKTTSSLTKALKASREGADYISCGPLYSTKSKTGKLLKGIGIDEFKKIRKNIKIPLVAIGGLNLNRIKTVKDLGADSFALISSLYKNNNIEENCQAFSQKIKG